MTFPVFTRSFAYILTLRCNLACHACDQAAPLAETGFVSPEVFRRDLAALAPVLHTGALRITGGEPLLHPQLLEILGLARASGIADCLRLLTNGLLLHRAPTELWKLVDDICISLYPDVKLPQPFSAYAETARRHGVILRPIEQGSFLQSILNTRIESPELVERVYRQCRMAHQWSCHALHGGHYFKCTIAPQFGWRLARLGIAYDASVDGVPVHNNPALAEQLERYLNDDRPLAACAYCLGTCAPRERHRLLDRQGVEAWWREDHAAVIAATAARLKKGGTVTVVVGGEIEPDGLVAALETVADQAGVEVDTIIVGSARPEIPQHWQLPVRCVESADGWAAANRAIRGATGQMVCFMESRHRLEWTFLQACASVFVEHPEIDLVLAHPSDQEPHFEWRPEVADLPALLARPPSGPLVVRREALVAARGLDPDLEDWQVSLWDLVLRLSGSGRTGMTAMVPATLFGCAATRPAPHAFKRLLQKHRVPYEDHLLDLLGLADGRLAEADRDNALLRGELTRLEQERSAAAAEAAALRASRSWRITRPLRRAQDLLCWFLKLVRRKGWR